jgi:hypothetical protein
MRTAGLVLLVLLASEIRAQERGVPSDSTRLTLSGCARGNLFTVRWRADHETTAPGITEGRRFRLTGNRDVVAEVRKREGSMVELTGLVRRNAVAPPQGVSVGGIRIGIGPPQQSVSDPARTPDMYQPVLDVESYRLLPESCPRR